MNGEVHSMDDNEYFFKVASSDMAAKSLCCVAIAYRLCELEKVPVDEQHLDRWDLPADDLILLAIVGIKDPCHDCVKEVVKVCTDAGVKVCMVTGDNIQTAKAIAIQCGILNATEDAFEPTII